MFQGLGPTCHTPRGPSCQWHIGHWSGLNRRGRGRSPEPARARGNTGALAPEVAAGGCAGGSAGGQRRLVGAARAAGAGRGARAANGQRRRQERGEAMAEAAGAGELVAQGRAGGHGAGQAAGAASCGGGDAWRRGRGRRARVGRAQCPAGVRWSCAGVGTAAVSARERGGAHGGGVGTRAVGSGRSDEVDRRRGRGGSDGKWRRVDDEARPRLHLGAA